jgi:hypothetical protein
MNVPSLACSKEQEKSGTARFFKAFVEDYQTGCWEWQWSKNAAGYGQFYWVGSMRLAHRISYYLFRGIDLGELCGCHTCDNPGCVNPAHIFAGTRLDNRHDAMQKGRPRPGAWGERASKAKLKERDIPEIISLRKSGLTFRAIAARYGVFHSSIIKVCQGKSWKHLNLHLQNS